MSLNEEQRKGMAGNIQSCLIGTIDNLKQTDGKSGKDAQLLRQLCFLTIALVTLVDLQLANTPESLLVRPN